MSLNHSTGSKNIQILFTPSASSPLNASLYTHISCTIFISIVGSTLSNKIAKRVYLQMHFHASRNITYFVWWNANWHFSFQQGKYPQSFAALTFKYLSCSDYTVKETCWAHIRHIDSFWLSIFIAKTCIVACVCLYQIA